MCVVDVRLRVDVDAGDYDRVVFAGDGGDGQCDGDEDDHDEFR